MSLLDDLRARTDELFCESLARSRDALERDVVRDGLGLPPDPPLADDHYEPDAAWLIERHEGGVAVWWNGSWLSPRFTSEPSRAVRFCRRQDAQAVIDGMTLTCRAVEHVFVE